MGLVREHRPFPGTVDDLLVMLKDIMTTYNWHDIHIDRGDRVAFTYAEEGNQAIEVSPYDIIAHSEMVEIDIPDGTPPEKALLQLTEALAYSRLWPIAWVVEDATDLLEGFMGFTKPRSLSHTLLGLPVIQDSRVSESVVILAGTSRPRDGYSGIVQSVFMHYPDYEHEPNQ